MTTISSAALRVLLVEALQAEGFSAENAAALARQTVLSEELGQKSVGLAHVFDYIESRQAGRVDGQAEPQVGKPAPTMLLVDGGGGLPQRGFEVAFDDLCASARKLGMAAFLQRNTTLCGSLGTFALQVAEAGLVAFAATNGSTLLAGSGSLKPVYCTNPMAFAAPQAGGPPLLIDQSSSATAYVNLRGAAARGEAIPEGWALDGEGRPTTDPKAALEGTLLPFAGSRGGNIALMVEVLAGGLTGANWSLDAPQFNDGDACPATGLFVLAIDPAPVDRGFAARLGTQLKRLAGDYGVYIPGLSKAEKRRKAADKGIEVDDALLARLKSLCP